MLSPVKWGTKVKWMKPFLRECRSMGCIYMVSGVCRENSQRRATVSHPWTENTGGSSTSWPRCTAWKVWATTANPNATWSSQLTSKADHVNVFTPNGKNVSTVELRVCSCCQGEGGLSQLNPDVSDRKRDGCESSSSHPSYQTTQQQVRILQFIESPVEFPGGFVVPAVILEVRSCCRKTQLVMRTTYWWWQISSSPPSGCLIISHILSLCISGGSSSFSGYSYHIYSIVTQKCDRGEQCHFLFWLLNSWHVYFGP